MKAGLPQKEPGIAGAPWEQNRLLQGAARCAPGAARSSILHDGPPYANWRHAYRPCAVNHILKDMVCPHPETAGPRCAFTLPGWDCHGLPDRKWEGRGAVSQEEAQQGRGSGSRIPRPNAALTPRTGWMCSASKLKRLGIMGDWDNPYLTMDPQAEGTIVAELLKFAEAGNLYRGSKPVMWSPVEKTALAEAEVEYEDITSTQIDVAFEIVESPMAELVGAHAVIWTTTPWTIPVNQALAYGPEISYRLLEIVDDEIAGQPELEHLKGKRFVIAMDLEDAFLARLGLPKSAIKTPGWYQGEAAFPGTLARHPMHHLGGFYAAPRPLLPGDFVTTDSGTGLVHMAPDHGEDDFDLCKSAGINPVFAVMDDGRYRDDWGWLGGADERRMSVINPKFNAPDGPICSDLREAGALLAGSADYAHSYPHSWRSKAKVIFRCTPQWFVPMDSPLPSGEGPGVGGPPSATVEHPSPTPSLKGRGSTLRERAVAEIARVEFIPEKGRNRIGAMVEGRPDWVLSRQRAWGVPITLFVRPDGTYLQDPDVNARIVAAVMQEGVDAWDEARKAEYLGSAHNPDDYEMVTDILDVWFDSGCTHAFVLESGRWPDLTWPANLYLEGSDQHRGWFQSSLLQSSATRGRAPYDQVLTHGFTMDAKGRKMSKSEGNTISPVKVMEQTGADIIRLWALSVDFTEDHRIGDEILKGVGDQYRKLRNTFRYLLGALDGFVGDMSDGGALPELEVYILALLSELDGKLKAAAERYDFNLYTRLLVDFCNEDLSAFYFDIRKDSLYCDGPDSVTRNAYRTVLDLLFHALIRYAAPVLWCSPPREVWLTRLSRRRRGRRQRPARLCPPARMAERARGARRCGKVGDAARPA